MTERKNKPVSKIKKLAMKIDCSRFSFNDSQADLELITSIDKETYANTKPGDPSYHAYVAAANITTGFATKALDILELIPFNNQLAELQDEYMPSYPPISPVTSAFFSAWMILDAQDAISGVTLGELFFQYLQGKDEFNCVQRAMKMLNDSYCSFYEVTHVDSHGVTLWDIANQKELDCWNSSGYPGRKGEIWYVRLLPPFVNTTNRSVTICTPYVFRDIDRHKWEQFFQRYLASKPGKGRSLREYLKYGKSLGYWLEFVFQAFMGYSPNMILVTGIPDIPASLPHYHPKHKL